MFTSLRIKIPVLLAGVLLLTACSLSGSSDKTPTTGLSATGTSSGTPATDSGTPSGTPDVIQLAPPVLVANSGTETQPGNYGSYYWMISSGLADKANARGIEIQKTALDVAKGSTVQFTWDQQNSQSDSTLTGLSIEVYPEESSIETVTVAQGTMQGFKASGTPVATTSIPISNSSWAADVPAGNYFVLIKADWSNPIVSSKPRNCEYGFLFKVS
ncbi:MAG: hypothetical protein WBW04_21185 [Nitrolancea sp.]